MASRTHCKQGHDLAVVGRCARGGCKQCRNENQRVYRKTKPDVVRKTYLARVGWTLKQYEDAAVAQDGRCAICNRTQDDRSLAADHDHSTMKPRGLLCFSCNTALGHFGDSVETLESAIRYLKRFK